MRALTFGVEEEFLLLDPANGYPVPQAGTLLGLLRGRPEPRAELMRFQFELATGVCTTADELEHELAGQRRLGADAARAGGCRLVASGVQPYGRPTLAFLTDHPRYREMARRFPALTAVSGTCGCHVHVGVPSRALRVRALAELRPWLATLLAISANSPVQDGGDSGWASRRFAMISRWPTARAPGLLTGPDEYDYVVRTMIARGGAVDERGIYLLARLSPSLPTVEIRVADVCPDVETALLVAILSRALVMTAGVRARIGIPAPHPSSAAVDAALDAAARHGMAGPAIDPFNGRTTSPWQMTERLLDHAGAALRSSGDDQRAEKLLIRLRELGTGADRQRTALTHAASPGEFIAALAGEDPRATPARSPGRAR
ncbi:YbdK family carboxylate-amine ligase [Actinoplanes sp. LDG1-06]|uniref:Putative glutamate--cysteine ligase 2 n=1 Tax=Paractinoplanes ovalisporus TaxID=2810368 RepID=A0ABS2A962_9ACTN|nr:YbdK family carboxylate-amine ligase [Actinoplanes ovalisporus]MBM2616374.1 YbdK family carboxylate-amine ligase [Actinoplanes ovalisporus]